MKTFWIRTASATVYALLFLGTLLSGRLLNNPKLGLLLFGAFLLFVTMGCTFEFFRMVGKQGAVPCRLLGYAYAVITLVAILISPMLSDALLGFRIMLVAITLLPVTFALSAIVQLWKESEQPFRDAAYTLVPMLYIALPLSLMSSLIPDVGAYVVLMIVVMVWVNDSGAYIGGSLFGKHKMWARHSPGKTWEGTAFGVLVTLLLAVFVVVKLGFRGGSLDLGTVIMIFLSLGLMLHGTPMAYVRAFGKATMGAAGIILQFPLYAGIMGIITGVGANGVSMGNVIADFCVNISNPVTYPLITFFFAALLNMFVPSGGGHWAIQAPIMLPAAATLGVDAGLTGTAIAWGDAWTNLIQPFWALPALAIAKLSARDIMGYCLVDLFITGAIICGGLVVWAL